MNGHYGHYKEHLGFLGFGKSFKREDKIVEKGRKWEYIDLCSIRLYILYIYIDLNGMLLYVMYIDG